MLDSSIWPPDWTLSDAITPGQSALGSDDGEGVTRIPQMSSIAGASYFLMSYREHSLELGSYSSAGMLGRCILSP